VSLTSTAGTSISQFPSPPNPHPINLSASSVQFFRFPPAFWQQSNFSAKFFIENHSFIKM
jgi:hypothetical protein